MNSIKTVVVFCCVLFSMIACERDFENIGVNIVDNNVFNTSYEDFDVVANTVNVNASRVDRLPRYTIGVYRDENFGKLEASFITQLGLPISRDFGLDPVIDTVIVEIPYFAVALNERYENGSPKFRIDSLYGDVDNEYELRIHRLNTFLNTLEPSDPSKNKEYYSNESYEKGELLAYHDNFIPDATDTVLYIKRSLLNEIDTIKREVLSPSLKISLNEEVIKNTFVNSSDFINLQNVQEFNNYFRGLFIEAKEKEEGGSVMTLNTSQATMTIYYTNTILTDETEQDLNGDGDLDDKQVPVLTKQSFVFPFSGISTATYARDYSGSSIQEQFNSFSEILGQKELFIQGAAGSIIELDLFRDIDLDVYRNKNWLINGAILDVYVKEGQDDIPNKLYLYNLEYNSVLQDVFSEVRVSGIDGNLDKDEDGNPVKYRFLITDYISEVLKSSDYKGLSRLALKTYHSTDLTVSALDTIVRDFSWNPRGVIVKGTGIESTDADYGKRMKLRIYYTEDTN